MNMFIFFLFVSFSQALEDTLVRQDELIALLEKKNKKKKKRSKFVCG